MQPTLCSKCKKNVAVVFISRMNEKNEMVNEGLCLKCAAQLGLPQVEGMMKRMGITPEDLENINSEMMQAFGGAEELDAPVDEGEEDDEESGKTATFPFLNRLFSNGSNPPAEQQPSQNGGAGQQGTGRKTEKKRKFLDNYCINLSQRAREGKLDAVIGREQEIERVVQILNRITSPSTWCCSSAPARDRPPCVRRRYLSGGAWQGVCGRSGRRCFVVQERCPEKSFPCDRAAALPKAERSAAPVAQCGP